MTGLLAITYLWLILKDDNLLGFAIPLRGGNHLGPVDSGRAYSYLIAVSNK